ncbi:MAG: hypothetical protein LBP27_03390, partial [Treponema sp.]|nr:hypothetical protein [Treponema sp.]
DSLGWARPVITAPLQSSAGFFRSPPAAVAAEARKLLAVCCASRINYIKIHEGEFLYLANCHRTKGPQEPDNRDFLHEGASKTP